MATALRGVLERRFFLAAGCFDVLSAKLAERAGFDAVHVSGYAVAATQFGVPDIGLLGRTDVLEQSAKIIERVQAPVICDVDAGFGPVTGLVRTVEAFERAGAAAIHIEDQAEPKRCPALEGRQVIDAEAFVAKLQAALSARRDPSFMIVARSDADEIGFQELVRRANLYLEAGADMVMPLLMKVDGRRIETLDPDEQMRWHARLVEEVDGPVLGIAIPPGHTAAEMRSLGYSGLIITLLGLRAAANAIASAYRGAIETGSGESYLAAQSGEMQSHAELMELLGIARLEEIERAEGQKLDN
jgi:2-methylisocitrate lyase-like PEP mutase family enzyme